MTTTLPRSDGLWSLGALAGAALLLSFGGDSWQAALRYERYAVLSGEVWRLLCGHLVHGGRHHLMLNLAGLALIGMLFRGSFSARQWLGVMLASLLCIDAGLLWLEPTLGWYVGLSGLLHGLMAAGAVAWWRDERRSLALTLTVVFAAKLAWEQLAGPLPGTSEVPTIVDAHLYGAIGGLVAGLWIVGRPAGRRL